jgi:hypothetical protein
MTPRPRLGDLDPKAVKATKRITTKRIMPWGAHPEDMGN